MPCPILTAGLPPIGGACVALAGGLLVMSAAPQLWVGYLGSSLGVGVAVTPQ